MRGLISRLPMVLALLAGSAAGQRMRVPGLAQRPRLTAGDTITVSSMPASVSFALVSKGVASGSTAVAITTSWSGVSLLSSIALYASFASASAALSGGTPVVYNISSSSVLGIDPPGGIVTTYTPFTGTNPINSSTASLELFQQSSSFSLSGSHSDSLSLRINLSALPQLPAASYTGTLNLQAIAF